MNDADKPSKGTTKNGNEVSLKQTGALTDNNIQHMFCNINFQ